MCKVRVDFSQNITRSVSFHRSALSANPMRLPPIYPLCSQLALHAKRRPSTKEAHPGPKPHVVSSAVEHPAISKCLDHLEAEGKVEVTYVKVDGEGRVSVEDVVAAFRPETALVTVMHSNNEVQ